MIIKIETSLTKSQTRRDFFATKNFSQEVFNFLTKGGSDAAVTSAVMKVKVIAVKVSQ